MTSPLDLRLAPVLLRRVATSTLAAAVLTFAACGGGSDSPPPPTEPANGVASLRITRAGAAVGAEPIVMEVGQAVDLVATPLNAAGTTVSRPVAWSSAAPGVAAVDASSGRVTAAAVGTARLTASAGGRQAPVDVAVHGRLTVTLAGVGGGSITGTSLSCTENGAAGCTALYAPGASVTLTAAPNGTSTFGGWGGACAGAEPTCTVTLDQLRAVTANFARRRVTVTVDLSGQGNGQVLVTGGGNAAGTTCTLAQGQGQAPPCAVPVDAGTTVNLTAQPDTATSAAGSWSGPCSGSAAQTCAIPVTGDVTVGATFTARSVASAVDSVVVTLLGNPASAALQGSLGIEGQRNGRPIGSLFTITMITNTASATFRFVVDRGTSVSLRFQPSAGSRFVSWGGACATGGTAGPPAACTVTSTARTEVPINVAPSP